MIAILGLLLPPHKMARLLALCQVRKRDYVQERESAFKEETVDSLFNLAAGVHRK